MIIDEFPYCVKIDARRTSRVTLKDLFDQCNHITGQEQEGDEGAWTWRLSCWIEFYFRRSQHALMFTLKNSELVAQDDLYYG